MEKLRVAAIGVGGMGKGHLDSIVANKSVIVKAVCDSNQAALDAVTLPKVRKYSDWRRLLDEEELDLLSVCLPHYLYPPVVIAALERGLHVYKDKPFAKDLADAREMAAAAEKHGRRIFIGAQRKFTPSFLKAMDIVKSGALGKIHFVRGAIHYYWDNVFTGQMRWRGRREESGGIAIIDSGYHILDAVMAYCGTPSSVYASTGSLRAAKAGVYDIDDKAALVLNFPDGALGALTISFATVPNEFRVVLHGQESTLDIDSSAMRLYQADKLKKTFTVNDAKTDTLKTQFAHCVKALRSGSPSLCDIEQALEVQTVIEAAYRSDKEKTAIEIKPGPR